MTQGYELAVTWIVATSHTCCSAGLYSCEGKSCAGPINSHRMTLNIHNEDDRMKGNARERK